MKRIHIHIGADDLAATKQFYSALFGQEPTVEKPDYLKWMIEDPRINLAVSKNHTAETGVNHVGIQVDSDEELDALNAALETAQQATRPDPEANCCYAHSNKHWASDPQGVVWEMFHTMEDIPTYYGGDIREDIPPLPAQTSARTCC